jgi:hypothetical protein
MTEPQTETPAQENAFEHATSWVSDLGERGIARLNGDKPVSLQSNGVAIAGMILGIVAITVGFWMTGFVEIPAGVIGLILSCVGYERANRGAPNKGMAITGIVLTLVAAPLYFIALILTLGLIFII